MISVQVVLFDGFDLLDAIAPYEVFCAATLFTENTLNVELVTAEGPRFVTSGINGLKIEAHGKLNPELAGIIVVPGASGPIDGHGPASVPSILGAAANSDLTGLMERALGRNDVIVATVCGGSLVLAMGGLLEGRSAVTNHLGMDLLGATGAIPVSARVVDDGNLVTGGGVTSGLDVALYLLERELGPRIALAVEQLFEFERRGTVWRAMGMAPNTQMTPADESANIPSIHDDSLNSKATFASAFDGDWDTTIVTPVGKLEVRLSISTNDGIIQGTATQGNDKIPFINPVLLNDKLAWNLRVTKPLRLNLKFEVSADGELMTGVAKAGLLPASKLTGKRISGASS
ncbi:DJ-1/PfpI family protein [Paenibacillus vini]|uniref:DJ-1/PfpI domain-containing protein n=1 Tax=Paenibacillus vini TaxID=1476024 RepID=A0ABQ4MCX7_9BACL|nr:DJ-1/PfpI family protein [Paenibacillus vini]GIP53838.1 hypothetical protein J42TS3_28730 [Paenibacillus vini]